MCKKRHSGMTQQFFQSVVKNKEKIIDANFELICVSMDIFENMAAQKYFSCYQLKTIGAYYFLFGGFQFDCQFD